MFFRETLTRCRTNVLLEDATLATTKIRWTEDDGDTVLEGTVRGGSWTPEGQLAGHTVDRRDACIRVTMKSGAERFPSWQLLADLYEEGAAALG